MNHIVAVRTHMNTEVFSRFIDSLNLMLETRDHNSPLYVVVVDDSYPNSGFIEKNLACLARLKSPYIKTFHLAVKDLGSNTLCEHLLAEDKSYLNLLSEHRVEDLDKTTLSQSLGGVHATLIASQLACYIVSRNYNLDPTNTIFSFYDDDVIFKTQRLRYNKLCIEQHDFFSNIYNNFTKGAILSYGKYVHHHGNVFVELERTLDTLTALFRGENPEFSIFDNCEYLSCNRERVFEKYMDMVSLSIEQRSPVLDCIYLDHYSGMDKRDLIFDEGAFSILGSHCLRYPFPSFGYCSPFMKLLLESTVSNLKDKTYIENPIMHIRPSVKRQGDHLGIFNINSILCKPSFTIQPYLVEALLDPSYKTTFMKELECDNDVCKTTFFQRIQDSRTRYIQKLRNIEYKSNLLRDYINCSSIDMQSKTRLLELTKARTCALILESKSTDISIIGKKYLDAYIYKYKLWKSLMTSIALETFDIDYLEYSK